MQSSRILVTSVQRMVVILSWQRYTFPQLQNDAILIVVQVIQRCFVLSRAFDFLVVDFELPGVAEPAHLDACSGVQVSKRFDVLNFIRIRLSKS